MSRRGIRCVALLAMLIWLLTVPIGAVPPSAVANGPEQIVAGGEFVVALQVNALQVTEITGTLQYDTDLLMLVNLSAGQDSPWQIQWSGNRFTITHPTGENLSNTAVLRITFATGQIADGTRCAVTFANLQCCTQGQWLSIENAQWEGDVAKTLSRENRLQDLSVENGTMEPEFHAAQNHYQVTVPYETETLDLRIVPREGTTFKVENPTLTPGMTVDVVITVTAENGETRAYVLSVTRATAGSTLTELYVPGFPLSPVFHPEVTEYALEVSAQTQLLDICYSAKDPDAQVQIVGHDRLYPGLNNRVELTVTGSDGSVTVYNLHVFRPEPVVGETIPVNENQPEQPGGMWQEVRAPWWLMVLLAAGLVGVGAALTWLHMSKRKGKKR